MTAEDKKTCFIAMPITTHPDEAERYGGDTDHWAHVMESIHVPAVKAAGFEPIRPVSRGTQMIMGDIIKHLSEADMVLCDLSGLNPNVFFELGVRTSLNLPIALVKDEHFKLPFDTSGLNTHHYDSTLRAWNSAQQISEVEQHISASAANSDGHNAMWKHFGLTIAADSPPTVETSTDAQVKLMFETMNDIRDELADIRRENRSGLSAGGVSTGGLSVGPISVSGSAVLIDESLARVAANAGREIAEKLGTSLVGIADVDRKRCKIRLGRFPGMNSMTEMAEAARQILEPHGLSLEMVGYTETIDFGVVKK